jgi:hypothetical protein
MLPYSQKPVLLFSLALGQLINSLSATQEAATRVWLALTVALTVY